MGGDRITLFKKMFLPWTRLTKQKVLYLLVLEEERDTHEITMLLEDSSNDVLVR